MDNPCSIMDNFAPAVDKSGLLFCLERKLSTNGLELSTNGLELSTNRLELSKRERGLST